MRDKDPSAQSRYLIGAMAGVQADRFLKEGLLPAICRSAGLVPTCSVEEARLALLDPVCCLSVIYSRYAFSRRGKGSQENADIAVEALSDVVSQGIEELLVAPNASAVWTAYLRICEARAVRPNEQLNRGVIAGLAELAQDIYRYDGRGSIAGWIAEAVRSTGKLEQAFLRIVDIRGVGPKLSATLLRDVVLLFDIEERVEHAHRVYLQPIDKWIRLIAPYIVEEPGIEDAADWVLAGKVAKYVRRSGASGVKFNAGVSWFGSREVRLPEFFDRAIQRVLREGALPAQAVVRDREPIQGEVGLVTGDALTEPNE